MSVTAQQVFELTMGLMDELTVNGSVNTGNTIEYKARVPKLLSMLQIDIARIEGVDPLPGIITSIDQALVVSDYSCINVLPWGLASMLVIEENEITAPYFERKYLEMKRKIPTTIEQITDIYIDDGYGGGFFD